MPVTEHPMQALANYLPDNSFEPVVQYIHHYKVHLTVTKKRKSVCAINASMAIIS